MPKLFESWCPKRQEKLLVPGMTATSGHESAGRIFRPVLGGKYQEFLTFIIEDQPIELHVCKHCGCVFAQIAD